MKTHLTNHDNLSKGRPKGVKTFNRQHALAFGIVLRQMRTKQGISQEKLAHFAGIERNHVGKIERGEHIPSLSIILAMAQALDISAGVLVSKTEQLLANDMQRLDEEK